MRLLKVDLERYGPFTGQRLAFRPDARLHIVYGANEAGKSCSLAAITDLFFGIDRKTRYDFLHEGKELCIGATIVSAEGESLTFRRRKNKPVLTDAADRPLPDDALAAYLGGMSREVFCRAFGLNPEALRASGDELRSSDGELGSALFAAGSGLRGFNELRAALHEEADAIFAPRASNNRRFYQALDRFEQARKAIKDRELRAADWKSLNERISEYAHRLEEIATERAKCVAEMSRLSRLKRAAPIVHSMDGDRARITSLGTLPQTTPALVSRLQTALEALANANQAHSDAVEREQKLEHQHARIEVDGALIACAGEIESLFSQTVAYANSRSQLPRVKAEADGFARQLDELAVRLGFQDRGSMLSHRPSDMAQALVRDLIEEGRDLEVELTWRRRETGELRETLAELDRQCSERGGVFDPAPIRAKLEALSPVLKRLSDRADVVASLEYEARKLREDAARLSPSILNLDSIASASLPSREVVVRMGTSLDSLEKDLRREHERLDTARANIEAGAQRLRSLEAARTVPTPEKLAEVRRDRDLLWDGLRSTLFAAEGSLTGVELSRSAVKFELLVAEADRLADDAKADATRVAEHASETARVESEQKTEADALQRSNALQIELAAEKQKWLECWLPTGVNPGSPAEMGSWLVSVGTLFDRREALQSRRKTIAVLDADALRIELPLRSIADELSLPLIPNSDPLVVASQLGDRLKAAADDWSAARNLEVRRAEAARRLGPAQEAEGKATLDHETWQVRWTAALPTIGLPSSSKRSEAHAALEAWKELPGVERELENRTRRVVGMRRETLDPFEGAAKALLIRLAPDLTALEPDAALKALHGRLSDAQAALARRKEVGASFEEARRGRADAGRGLGEAQRAVAEVAENLGELGDDDLSAVAVRLIEREEIESSLRSRREQLINAADGYDESALREALAALDLEAVETGVARASQRLTELEREANEVFAAKDREERRLAELEQGVGAEVALQEKRNAEAELLSSARDFAVVKLAAILTGAAIERQRAARKGPLMERAGMLFSTLTGGSFLGLGQEFDDDETPHIIGRRSSGKTARVTEMSEGTRDQLYLALRLAYLEDYASRAEPMPFVGDDLFASFDDERTANGLRTLVAIGGALQPVLFTHHSHLVDLAVKELGPAVDVLNLRVQDARGITVAAA